MGFLRGIFRSRDAPKNSTSGSAYRFFMGNSSSGKRVNERSAMQMTAVYSCVRILSEAVAGLPLHLYRYTSENSKEKATDSPLYFLLHDETNPEMSSFVFRETLMTHLLLWGNAYAQIIRNGKGEVIGMYPLMPDRMNVDRDEHGKLYYEYMVSSDDAPINKVSTVKLQPSDVLHIPGLGFDGLVGYSPIAMAKNAIGLAIAAEEYGSKFYANGATPSGILEYPGTVKEPEKVRESWNAGIGGSSNSHKVAVLEEGMKYTPISISPNEAQFLETRKFQINEIARIFRVPPHMVGDLEKSSFSNIEQQSLEFVKYTLEPWLVRWEQAMQRALISPNDKAAFFIKFNVDGLLRGDYQSRMSGYATARQNGWMSANDIRELENLDHILYTITDAFNTVSVQDIVSTAAVVMDFKSGGKGVAVGKVSETDNCFEVSEDWDVKVYGKLLEDYIKSIAGAAYPVGSIYMSVTNTNPSAFFGGTWVAWGTGRVPVGVNASDTNFATVEKTGGASTVTLSTAQIPSHSHGKGTLAADSGGTHKHNLSLTKSAWGVDSASNKVVVDSTTYTALTNKATSSAGAHGHTISGSTAAAGSGNAHSNLQPYITCYMWKRTQ